MNEQNYKDLKNNIVKIFKNDTVIAEGIKNLIEQLAEYFQANTQDVLFVTMKDFTNEYKTDSTIQYFHYLESVKPEKLANMLKITKEYNKASSEQYDMDIYNIYDNGREVLQYGVKYNQYTNMYDFYNLTDNKKITGLTYEKIDQVLSKEIERNL